TAREALAGLEGLRNARGGEAAAAKAACLAVLARRSLGGARAVERLHEALCFLRAYPDDAGILALVTGMLARFERRPDLRRHRSALEGTGIAGTAIRFPFFAGTARWIAARWGDRLTVDWRAFANREALERVFPLVSLWAEAPGLDELDLGARGWVKRLKGPRETDGAFLVRRLATLGRDRFENEWAYEGLELPLVLAPGPGGPSRTRAAAELADVSFRTAPLDGSRPDVRREVARPPLRVVPASLSEGRRLLDLAREAMVTRQRDLDVFQWGDPRDIRLAHFPDGLTLVAIGAVPEQRLLLESAYGFLTLKNGVPVGYVLVSALFGSSEIAYNVFETFRGGEAGRIYGKVLSLTRHLFGSDVFTIFPYQLGGYGNREALESGAWWFYEKLGFCPRAPRIAALRNEERARMQRDPAHRSSIATLKILASENLYFHLAKDREDALGLLELPNVGLAVTDTLARRFGSDRERAEAVLALEARDLLGLRSLAGWSASERLAFRRWAPLVAILPGLGRFTAAEKRALAAVIRAKGGRRESDFVRLFDAHRKLRGAIARLAGEDQA
ncbi:MAG TPA: hypothetical protein VFZ57_04135, partial [Thermoanaerobaculia bacterium]|nr:hypothetical protein [Thermoanaerobaculia bacterium]